MQESSFFEYLSDYFDETRGKERYQQGIQQGREQGREEGREQGREQGIQRGAEQGARENAIKNLFGILEFRFDDSTVQVLRPALESIKDLQSLEELHREALRAESFEAFARVLSMNGQK